MAQNNNKHQRKRRRTAKKTKQTNKENKTRTGDTATTKWPTRACRVGVENEAPVFFFFFIPRPTSRVARFFFLFSLFFCFLVGPFLFLPSNWFLFVSFLGLYFSPFCRFLFLCFFWLEWMLPSFTEFFFYKSLILASFLGVPDRFSVMLQVFYGFQWTWLVFNGFYLVSWSFTGCFHGSLWVLLGFT